MDHTEIARAVAKVKVYQKLGNFEEASRWGAYLLGLLGVDHVVEPQWQRRERPD